eukprot:10368030-Alexandrium_andersonii.AAC.1
MGQPHEGAPELAAVPPPLRALGERVGARQPGQGGARTLVGVHEAGRPDGEVRHLERPAPLQGAGLRHGG